MVPLPIGIALLNSYRPAERFHWNVKQNLRISPACVLIKFTLLLLALFLLTVTLAMAQQPRNPRDLLSLAPPPYDARIQYGTNANQFADLRLPQGSGPHPVVVVIHGGFWRAAYDLQYAGHMSAAITKLGFATWNIEYRRIGQTGGGYPGTLDDAAAALDHLAKIGSQKNLDLKRVYAIGHSAGGHLAMWLATRKGGAVRIRGAISLAGVGDLREAWDRKLGNRVVEEFMGCAPKDCPDKYDAASPSHRLPARIPLVMVHGSNDDIVPFVISQEFAQEATKKGDKARLLRLEGTGHFEFVDPRTIEWHSIEEALLTLAGRPKKRTR